MNKAPKDRFAIHQLDVVWPYGKLRLQQIKLTQELGVHARLWITGSMEADQTDNLIIRAGSHDEIELWVTDDNDRKQPLFMGQLYSVNVQHMHQEVLVTLEVISHSFKLDTQLKNRSFQHIDQKYVEIVDAVLADYQGSDKLDEALIRRPPGNL
jgi:hypothetical protein